MHGLCGGRWRISSRRDRQFGRQHRLRGVLAATVGMRTATAVLAMIVHTAIAVAGTGAGDRTAGRGTGTAASVRAPPAAAPCRTGISGTPSAACGADSARKRTAPVGERRTCSCCGPLTVLLVAGFVDLDVDTRAAAGSAHRPGWCVCTHSTSGFSAPAMNQARSSVTVESFVCRMVPPEEQRCHRQAATRRPP